MSLVGGEAIRESFEETIYLRVIASQKLTRDNGESIFTARHLDVSQGPLGLGHSEPGVQITRKVLFGGT